MTAFDTDRCCKTYTAIDLLGRCCGQRHGTGNQFTIGGYRMEQADLRSLGLCGGRDRMGDMPPPPPPYPMAETRAGLDCGCERGAITPLIEGTARCNGGCGCVGHEGCGEGSWGLNGYPLAMVYAPCQTFCALHDPATALQQGTLFSALDLPLGRTEGGSTLSSCPCCKERR